MSYIMRRYYGFKDSPIYELDAIYRQGCLDGAINALEVAADDFESLDNGKGRSKYKSAAQRINYLKNNIDMDFARNGFFVPVIEKDVGTLDEPCGKLSGGNGNIRSALAFFSLSVLVVFFFMVFLERIWS